MKTRASTKTNTCRAFAAAALFAVLSGACLGQEGAKKEPKRLYGGFGYSNFIVQHVNHSALNKELNSNGYGSLASSNYAFGGGGMFCVRNFLFGGGGAWVLGSQAQSPQHRLSMEGGYGFFNLGYVAYSRKNLLFYPLIGAGGGGYTLKIAKKDASGNFNEQLNTPSSMAELHTGGMVADVSLNAQLFFGKSTEGFFCGLRAGYRLSPENWNFSIGNSGAGGSPAVNMNGLYVSIILGGGSVTNCN